MKSMNEVKIENIMSVYSGRDKKCCCGCAGKYSYASAHVAAGSKNRGYAVGADEVSDLAVKRAFNRFQKNSSNVEFDYNYAALTVGTRLHVLYFLPEVK